MQTPASQPHKRCRVPGIVMMSCAAAATLLEERIDVATVLAWHSQARNSIQYASDATPYYDDKSPRTEYRFKTA